MKHGKNPVHRLHSNLKTSVSKHNFHPNRIFSISNSSRVRNKKGVQVAVTYVVVLIITILLLGLAFYFMGMIWGWFGDISEEVDKRTLEAIENLIKNQNAIVAIPFNLFEVNTGGKAVFGVGVKNIGAREEFGVIVRFQGAYAPSGREIMNVDSTYMNENWLTSSADFKPLFISAGEHLTFPITVKADGKISQQHQTAKGDYAFNVCVYKKSVADSGGKPSCETGSRDSEQNLLYPPKEMHTVTIRID